MRSLAVFLMLMLPLAFLFSCRKTGVNQNLDPNNQRTYDFMSTKNGSYWVYGSPTQAVYTRYARNMDTIKNSLKYSYFERVDSALNVIPEYFGKNGVWYITLIDLDGSNSNYVDYVFWKDSAVKGDSWNNVGSTIYPGIGTINLLTESTESDDDLTLINNGTTYNHVVHVHSDIKATNILNTHVGTLDLWFIKGLGVIREEANINILGFYVQQHTDSLLSYHIEP